MAALLQKSVVALLVLFYSLAALVPACHSATNLALGKPYTVFPVPNYPHSAFPDDRTALTDGRYTTGYFWTQKTTVGWQKTKRVEILIDLEKISTIGGISFNTARYAGVGVFFAQNIMTYVGPDMDHLVYVGDIADSDGNRPGEYQVTRFRLENINVRGRYVLFEILTSPRSENLFVDEIEVSEGHNDNGKEGNVTLKIARNELERLKRTQIEQRILKGLSTELSEECKRYKGCSDELAAIDKRISELFSPEDATTIENEIMVVRGKCLTRRLSGDHFALEAINPWASLSPVQRLSGQPLKSLSMNMPIGGVSHTAFLVTNPSSETRDIGISITKASVDAPDVSLFQVPFVKSSALEYVADPLMPLSPSFTLQPGTSRMVIVSAEGTAAGKWHNTLNVVSGGQRSSLDISCEVLAISLPTGSTLNSVNWGYLTFNPIKDRKDRAVKDLLTHRTNVLVVPPVYLRGANQYEKNNKLYRQTTYSDFMELESYLRQHRGVSKVLLGLGFGGANHTTFAGKYPFMSMTWRTEFKKWYAGVVLAATRAGYSEEQLYLYPYDEMGGKQIDDFISFAMWVKKEVPAARLYGTINENAAERAVAYLDVAQVSNIDDLLGRFASVPAEIWIYDTKYPAKSLSPYSYYRLMPWKAFLKGYRGIGFWAYADTGTKGTAWDDFDDDNGRPDFSVIYEGSESTIVSSRRWEAWRMGLEDYELLTMYSKAKGIDAAKALAQSVLDHPEDTSKADEARRKILFAVSNRGGN